MHFATFYHFEISQSCMEMILFFDRLQLNYNQTNAYNQFQQHCVQLTTLRENLKIFR